MIAPWMLYASVVTVLIGGAAFLLERMVKMGPLPGRWLWLGAVAAALAVPSALALRPPPARPMVAPVTPAGTTAPLATARVALTATAPRIGVADLDAPLLVAWPLLSLLHCCSAPPRWC